MPNTYYDVWVTYADRSRLEGHFRREDAAIAYAGRLIARTRVARRVTARRAVPLRLYGQEALDAATTASDALRGAYGQESPS